MNKFLKTFIAIIGAVDVVFSMFIPIAVSLLLINTLVFNQGWHTPALIIFGIISSFYRAVDVAFLRG